MIKYQIDLNDINQNQLAGFFVGWPKPPTMETHFEILKNSSHIVLAIDDSTNQVVGFINAVSDKTLSAYIPLLEVIPDYQNKGIARELVTKLLEQLKDFYMIDLACDENMVEFYKKFKFRQMTSMVIRNFDQQAGV